MKNEIRKESEIEKDENSENKEPESTLDINMPLKECESSESCTESQQSQTKSSHNHSEVSTNEAPLSTQPDVSENGPSQNYSILPSTDATQRKDSISDFNDKNRQLECNNEEQSSRVALDANEDGGVLEPTANTEAYNQDNGLEKQSHEGIKTCEGNLESQTNSDDSDKIEESLNSQPTQASNEAENANETTATANNLSQDIDTNVQHASDFSSYAADECTNNAETKYQEEMNTDHGFNDDRTNNGDVSSEFSNLNPSAMTENIDQVKKEEMSTDAKEQESREIMTYNNSKSNSPNTEQTNATPPLSSSLPASTNDSSNRIKDDPYNFSEEEDVFSPQLPSRQFSSSNANIAGSDSHDPALERLKAEHR